MRPRVVDGGDGHKIWRVAVNIPNKLLWIADNVWSTAWGLGEGLTNPYLKKTACYEILREVL